MIKIISLPYDTSKQKKKGMNEDFRANMMTFINILRCIYY